MVATAGGWQRCRAAFGVYKTIRRNRSTAVAVAMSRLKQQLQMDLLEAAVTAVVMAGTACNEGGRRTEQGRWASGEALLCPDTFVTMRSRAGTTFELQTTRLTPWSRC